MPFLTIGVSNFNYARYLEAAFRQIEMQSFQDYELLYCDDGSTDQSREIIRKFIREHPDMNIRMVEGSHEGILANKNRILEQACGKWLMICDADDYMKEGCLQALCSAAQNTDADCVIGGFEEVDDAAHLLKKHIPTKKSSKWLFTWHHAQMYRTELFQKNGIRFTKIPDDVCFLQKIHQYSAKTVFVSESVYCWVRHSDSVSSDYQLHPEWNPINIWTELSDFIADLRESVEERRDQRALDWYLYKWFFLNIADLSIKNRQDIGWQIAQMRRQMKKILPEYQKLSCLIRAAATQDTLFAQTAVFLCWILDRCGLLFVVSALRTWQKSQRQKRIKSKSRKN